MKLRSKWQVRERIQTVLNMLGEVDAIMEELKDNFSEQAKVSYYGYESMSDIFHDIQCNQMHDIDEIMTRLDELGALDGLPDDTDINDNINRFKEKLSAIELIKEAIVVGVLQAAGSKMVYVACRNKEEEYWAPVLIEDAALNLVDTGNVETLREAVENAKKESNG